MPRATDPGRISISTHALTWRATRNRRSNPGSKEFLPTPSHGGRPLAPPFPPVGLQFLPTPSHGGRLHTHIIVGPEQCISTHALTWRATLTDCGCGSPGGISTHALTWRATGAGLASCFEVKNFYPRPHMEGDHNPLRLSPCPREFLPTPSHGGRLHTASPKGAVVYFYPRPHMEGDPFSLAVSL